MTEDEVIRSAQSGNARAYEEIVRSYQAIAWKTALVILRDPTDAEDAVQSAMIKAWQHLDSFRTGSPFRPWFLRIVANESRNLRLSRARKNTRQVTSDAVPDLPDRNPDTESVFIVAERSQELVRHINNLPNTDREILYARYALDLTEPEMAEVLGIARGTVKSRLHRAIGRLRAQMATHEEVTS